MLNKMILPNVVNFGILLHKAVNKGLLLFGSTLMAILVANSSFTTLYSRFIEQNFQISFDHNSFSLSVYQWINEFLMSIFFLVVAMTIKREMIEGHLKSTSQRIFPIIAACFGVILPVVIYIAFNYKDAIAIRGWATPAATDVAFALGIFTIFGKSLPITLRVFITALAIIDDLIAVIIITLFYSGSLHFEYCIPIIICCILLYFLNQLKLSILAPYLIIGIFMWYCFFKSGIHSTISGVMLGIFIPLKISNHNLPLKKLKKILTPPVEYFILPLFAFSNSGIHLQLINFESFYHPVVLGIALGLFIGKTLGISFVVYILKNLKIISFTGHVPIKYYYYVSMLCGIGFTMSLFISSIAFANHLIYLDLAKVGIILGSLISTVLAIILMKILK